MLGHQGPLTGCDSIEFSLGWALREVHLPRVVGEIQRRKDFWFGGFNVHECYVHFFEFNRFRVFFLVECPS